MPVISVCYVGFVSQLQGSMIYPFPKKKKKEKKPIL